MHMNINDEKADFFNQQRERVYNYFKKNCPEKAGELAEAEDLTQESFEDFFQAISTRSYERNKWENLLNVIMKRKKVNYYRENTKKKKYKIINIDEAIHIDGDSGVIFNIPDKDKKLEEIINGNLIFGKLLPFVRGACLTDHRSLQEVLLIGLVKEENENLRLKLGKKYPNIAKRCVKKGIRYDCIDKKEIKNKTVAPQLIDDICSYNKALSQISNRLKVDDPIGFTALKILFCETTEEKRWKGWYALSLRYKQIYYSSFDVNGNLYRKKTIKRPYRHFFRDFISLNYSHKEIRKFLQEQRDNYVKIPVSEDYYYKYYKIGVLNNDILKKQKLGRTGKSKKIGLKFKVERYRDLLRVISREF